MIRRPSGVPQRGVASIPSTPLTDAKLAAIHEGAVGIDPSRAPPPGGIGGLGASALTLRFRSPQASWEKTLSSLDPAMLEVFDPLLEPVVALEGELYEYPDRARRLNISTSGRRFRGGSGKHREVRPRHPRSASPGNGERARVGRARRFRRRHQDRRRRRSRGRAPRSSLRAPRPRPHAAPSSCAQVKP